MIDTVEMHLARIFRDVLQRPDVELTPEMSAEDVPGLDSIRMISIILAVEETFAITLRASEIRRLRTIGDLTQLIRLRHG